MKIKRLIKYYIFNESVKEMELNKILDKVSKKKSLSEREIKFLNLYQDTRDEHMKDYLYLSKNSTFQKLLELLEKGKRVICDLHDRNGKIGLQILGGQNLFEKEVCELQLKGGETHLLKDKFLYNLIYNIKKDEYSLQEQDEYFEKIEADDKD